MKFSSFSLSGKLSCVCVFILLFVFLSLSLNSQVPFSTVKKDVLKEWKGVTVTDRGGGRVAVDESVFPNRRYYVAFVRADNKDKIEGHDVIYHRDLEVYYDIVGGKYVFNSTAKFSYWLTGDLKPPTFEDAASIINNNYTDIFSSYALGYLTDFEGIKEISKEKYSSFDGADNFYYSGESAEKKVWFKVKVVFSHLYGGKIEKREAIMEVELERDCYNCPWKTGGRGGMANIPDGKVLESRELSDEEAKSMECNTLAAKANIKKSLENFNTLPVVEIPQFKTARDMTWWIHRFLMNAKPLEAEYVFLKIIQPWYFLTCGNYMLNESGWELIEQVKKMVGSERGKYGYQYCENPKIKEQSGNEQDYQVAFYQKYGASFSRIRVGTFKGELKITDINLSWNTSSEFNDEIAKLPSDFCKGGEMAFWKTYNLKEFAIGASFPAEPKQSADPNNSSRQILKCDLNGIEWLISGEPISSGGGGGGGLFGKITKAIPKPDPKSMSEDTKNKFGASVEKEGVWQIRAQRGYDATWRANKDGNNVEMRYRSVIYKDVFYQIWVFGKSDPEDVTQFFESVSIFK